MRNLLSRLEKRRDIWFLIGISFVFFLLRLPSLYEPYWYGDEGIYETIGEALRAGRFLYTGAWDNKPPLLYVFYWLFGQDQFGIKLVSLLFGIATITVFFYTAKLLLRSEKVSFVVTSLFAVLFGLPLLEGNIANAENFMLFFILCAALLINKVLPSLKPFHLHHVHQRSSYIELSFRYQPLFLAGILLGIAFLFKIVAVFDFLAFCLFVILIALPKNASLRQMHQDWRSLVSQINNTVWVFVTGFLLPIIITLLFFLITGAFSAFIQAAFLNNIGYVGYDNHFIFPQGLLALKLLLLLGAIILLYRLRRRFPAGVLFILTWLPFSLFDLFFSQRPYTHYLLVFLPVWCLSIGILFLRTRWQIISIIILLLGTMLIKTQFTIYSLPKTIAYYPNFLAFLTHEESTETYQAFFDKNTPRDYQIAAFLKNHTKPGQIVFIWGNSAQIYPLSDTLPPGRYTVAYHITGKAAINETAQDLQRTNPQYMVLLPNDSEFPFSLTGYHYLLSLVGTNIYERDN